MSLFLPDPKTLYTAMLERDPAYDGHAFVAVTTTGIFCRLSCPARKPNFENSQFFDSAASCLQAGFRPCLRCRPLDFLRQREPLVADLMTRLEADPEHVWSEADLVALRLDPSTVRRAFRRHLGISFLELARFRRAGRGMAHIAHGSSIIEAQLEAGYDSASGFRGAIGRLVSDTPQHLKCRSLLKADWLETPIGAMLAVADEEQLHLLEFFDRKALPKELERLREATRSAIEFARNSVVNRIAAELEAFFAGRDPHFQTPLAQHGSPFTRTVWNSLLTIPPGTSRSYRDLAHAIGQPTALRAVARANGANQIAIVIPCHRVIGHDGSLTGYGGGLWRKQWLLEHERRAFGPKAQVAARSTQQGPGKLPGPLPAEASTSIA